MLFQAAFVDYFVIQLNFKFKFQDKIECCLLMQESDLSIEHVMIEAVTIQNQNSLFETIKIRIKKINKNKKLQQFGSELHPIDVVSANHQVFC